MSTLSPVSDPRLLSPLYVWRGGWLAVLSNMANQPHRHVAASLLVGLQGPLNVTVDGQRLDQQIVLVPPEQTQTLHSEGPVAVIHLDPDEPAWRGLSAGMGEHLQQTLLTALPPLAEAQAHPDSVIRLLAAMRDTAAVHPLDPRVASACRVLREHEEVDLEQLAEQANLSASRFRRLFSEQLGVTFKRFVLHLKSQRALALWESGMTLTELAVAAGFYDQPHLNRTLRAMFDALPSRYARGQPVQVVPLSVPEGTSQALPS